VDRQALVRELQSLVGSGQVRWQPKDLAAYSRDASFYSQLHDMTPDAVVLPRSGEDVAKTVGFACQNGLPVTPRGAGTGMTGGGLAARGGIVIDVSFLNRIVAVDALNLQVVAQAGVVHADLNARLALDRLFFPPDPGSSRMCTLGGMVSNNARGMRAIKYGATGDYVLGLEVVLPSGQVIQPGSIQSRAVQSSSGFDLHKVFVKAEGMLGVITLLRLKVLPAPAKRGIVLAMFDELEKCGEVVSLVFQAGIVPSALEILDRSAIVAANLYKPALNLPAADALLLFEVDGNAPGVACELQRIVDVVKPIAFHVDASDEPRRVASLWEARSVVGAAASMVKPGSARVYMGEDIAVPITAVPAALRGIRDIGEKYAVAVVTYGHSGNGGLHSALLIDPASGDEVAAALAVAHEIDEMAMAMGGTVTGEHGVGIARAGYMTHEHGASLEVMKQIKQALDSKGIMNPGKMWPEPEPEPEPEIEAASPVAGQALVQVPGRGGDRL
jgi:glycolate oxidase